MTAYVVGFAFDHKEQVVPLMLKARPGWQRGKINGIGGHIEVNEMPEDAMEREWKEEALTDSPKWTLFAILSGEAFVVYFFRANADITDVESGSDGEEIVLCDVDSLPPNVVPNLRWLVPMAKVSCSHDWPYHITEKVIMPYDLVAYPAPFPGDPT